MDTRDAAADRKKTDGRGRFEKFVEAVNAGEPRAVLPADPRDHRRVARELSAVVSSKNWQYAIHTVSSVISLPLLALLENAGRRSQGRCTRSSTSSPQGWRP